MKVIELLLQRKKLAVGFTTGILMFGGVAYHTMEDQVRDLSSCTKTSCIGKIPGETAIPAGRYEIKDTYSPRFKKNVLEVVNVPGFQGIRIHPGNTEADTEGCLLLGLKGNERSISESRKAIEQFNKDVRAEFAKGNKVFITITNGQPVVVSK